MLESKLKLSDIIKLIKSKLFVVFSIIFVCFGSAFIYDIYLIKDEYTSYGTLASKVYANVPTLNTLALVSKSDIVANLTYELVRDKIAMNNLDHLITAKYISENITARYVSNSFSVSVNFRCPDNVLSQTILNNLLDSTAKYANENYPVFANSIVVTNYSNNSQYTGTSSKLVYIFGFLSTVFLCFIYLTYKLLGSEKIHSYMYLKSRSMVVCNYFVKTNPNEIQPRYIAQDINLTDAILENYKNEKGNVIAFVSTKELRFFKDLVKESADHLASLGMRVLLINYIETHKNPKPLKATLLRLLTKCRSKFYKCAKERSPLAISDKENTLVDVKSINMTDLELTNSTCSLKPLLKEQRENYNFIFVNYQATLKTHTSAFSPREFDLVVFNVVFGKTSYHDFDKYIYKVFPPQKTIIVYSYFSSNLYMGE